MSEYISKQSVIDYLNGYLNSIVECGADSLFDTVTRLETLAKRLESEMIVLRKRIALDEDGGNKC